MIQILFVQKLQRITYGKGFCVSNEMVKTRGLNISKSIHSFMCLLSNYLPNAHCVSAAILVAGYLKSQSLPCSTLKA